MIPCKIFLQKLEVIPEGEKPKINLILNDIFYDQIKAFQTKYFCLTAHDDIQIEASYQQYDDIVGRVGLSSPHRLALNDETIQLRIENKNSTLPVMSVRLLLHLMPVTSFDKKKLGASNKQISMQNTKKTYVINEENTENVRENQMEISFSHKDPLAETNNGLNIPNLFPNDDYSEQESIKSIQPEGESLESLAYQRERILGQLFGRFKRDK